MKEKDKRYSNTYKCTSDVYNKAMRRAKKSGVYLSNIIEQIVDAYSKGATITAESKMDCLIIKGDKKHIH